MRNDHWRAGNLRFPDVEVVWHMAMGTQVPRPCLVQMASGHLSPYLVLLPSNAGFYMFDKFLLDSCQFLIWNPYLHVPKRQTRPQMWGSCSPRRVRETKGVDGPFIHTLWAQDFPCLPDRTWQELLERSDWQTSFPWFLCNRFLLFCFWLTC